MSDDHQMTRRQYREEQEKSSKDGNGSFRFDQWPHHQNSDNNMDESPLLSRRHHEKQDDITEDEAGLTRQQTLEEDKETIANEKTQQLKTKLNKIIIGLVLAIILIYLFLFFIG